MDKEKLKVLDHMVTGVVSGLVLPTLAMYFILKFYLNLSLIYIVKNPFFSPLVDSLKGAIFFNLILFFGFYWLKWDKAAKGVILATILYGGFYVWYKYFM